jgi:hypothetical protein
MQTNIYLLILYATPEKESTVQGELEGSREVTGKVEVKTSKHWDNEEKCLAHLDTTRSGDVVGVA